MSEERGIVKYDARDGQQVALSFDTIKRYLVQGKPEFVTRQEMMYFMGICKSRGLNPFNKDCYLMKYSERDSAAIIVSIDYFRKRAKAQPDCIGWSKGVIVDRKGDVVRTSGLVLETDKILGGWFRAQPKGWEEPYELEVNLSGYIKRTKSGDITSFWKKENQPSQISKVAESQGLRTVWPDEFQQLYTPEEIGPSDMFHDATVVSSKTTRASDLTDSIKSGTQGQRPAEYKTQDGEPGRTDDPGPPNAWYGELLKAKPGRSEAAKKAFEDNLALYAGYIWTQLNSDQIQTLKEKCIQAKVDFPPDPRLKEEPPQYKAQAGEYTLPGDPGQELKTRLERSEEESARYGHNDLSQAGEGDLLPEPEIMPKEEFQDILRSASVQIPPAKLMEILRLEPGTVLSNKTFAGIVDDVDPRMRAIIYDKLEPLMIQAGEKAL